MLKRLSGLAPYLVTVAHSKHRLFVWREATCWPDHAPVVIARSDDVTFGILHSRFPEHLTPRDTAGWGQRATISDKHEAPAATKPT